MEQELFPDEYDGFEEQHNPSQIDFCKFFSDIEANPEAITPQLTIRQFFQARVHVYNCDTCFNAAQRVLAQAPKDTFPDMGTN